MKEPTVRLISKISDYLRARVWLRDYTITRNSSGATQTGLWDNNGQAGQEAFCSLLNGSITPMDKLTH